MFNVDNFMVLLKKVNKTFFNKTIIFYNKIDCSAEFKWIDIAILDTS